MATGAGRRKWRHVQFILMNSLSLMWNWSIGSALKGHYIPLLFLQSVLLLFNHFSISFMWLVIVCKLLLFVCLLSCRLLCNDGCAMPCKSLCKAKLGMWVHLVECKSWHVHSFGVWMSCLIISAMGVSAVSHMFGHCAHCPPLSYLRLHLPNPPHHLYRDIRDYNNEAHEYPL